MSNRQYTILDRVIIAADNGVRSLFSQPIASRKNPAADIKEEMLSSNERQQSAALMRINHTGEVCAQALYYGQAMTARSKKTKDTLLRAAEEETDHLAWCQDRISELHNHTSYLNPLWYIGSFSLGLVMGAISDQWSLGFVVETERQVEKHLQQHLQLLPPNDIKSQQILQQMCEDESHHATVAIGAGAIELPAVVKMLMKAMSKIMTKTTYYI